MNLLGPSKCPFRTSEYCSCSSTHVVTREPMKGPAHGIFTCIVLRPIYLVSWWPQTVVSLDQIASRLEHVQSPALSNRSRGVLSTQKPGNSLEPATPTWSKPEALWAHMPSSHPDAPSSPPSDGLQLMKAPCHIKSGSSLEWACAKERMGNKYRLKQDKGTQLVEL